jgi:flagellar assembly protein FliH
MARVIRQQGPGAAPPAAPIHMHDLRAEARRTILFARRRAKQLIDEAEQSSQARRMAEHDGAREEGYRAGYREGLEQGRQAGRDEAREASRETFRPRIEDALDAVESAAGGLDRLGRQLEHQVGDEVLELAVKLAEKIVGEVASRDVQAARWNLSRALGIAEDRLPAVVEVCPDQLVDLRGLLPEICRHLERTAAVQLRAGEGIAPGGARVFCGDGCIDATIETQMDNVVAALLGPRRAAAGPDDLPGRGEVLEDD